MRLWHVIVIVLLLAVFLGIARSEQGRISLCVFLTTLAMMGIATAALLHLFKTVGAFGAAKTPSARFEAAAATVVVVVVSAVMINAVLLVGMAIFRELSPL